MKEKFYEKFQNKSDSELEQIIQNANRYQKNAVDLAKKFLNDRKNNNEKKQNEIDEKKLTNAIKKEDNESHENLHEAKVITLSYKRKSLVVFIEYFVFSILFQMIFVILGDDILEYQFNEFFSKYLICFFAYYSLSELIFKRTLVMHIFGIELVNVNGISLKFIIYSISSILDRTIFAPFHLLLAFLNFNKLLLCEKVSGIRWNTSEKNVLQQQL